MSPPKRRRRLPRRRLLITITVALVLGASVAAYFFSWSRRARPPAPPVVDVTGIDPAVSRAVESARAAVGHAPHSAENWGKLGMILLSHGLHNETAVACLVQAEQLDRRQPRWPYLQ